MRKFLVGFALLAACQLSENASAQVYPSRPITVVVPFPAGGPADTLARIVTERMRTPLGQPIIIENAGGAGGSIAVTRVVRAAPDGHTLCLGNWTSHVGAPAIYPIQVDILKDMEPISLLPIAPLSIAAHRSVPASNLPELIAWLKANPGTATAGTVGSGSPSYISSLHFQKVTDTRIQLVPYRGGAPATQDLMSGQIHLRIGGEASVTLPYIRSGQIKVFAVMGKTRWSAAPDIPTIDEAGISGLNMSLWFGLWAPKGTPSEIIDKLNSAVVETLADPAIRQRFVSLGQDIPTREQQTPQGFAAFHKAEIEKWWPIIKAANVKAP
jgi:tripartite-type tricarboxylate transporter receptor subunit TctC